MYKMTRQPGFVRPAIFAIALTVGLSGPAGAAETVFLGAFGDWESFHAGEGKSKICYTASRPTSKSGKYKKRGAIQIFVTHQPGSKITDEVNVVNGYTFKKGSVVTAHVGKKRFNLFTRGGGAWAKSRKTEREMVAEMKKRHRMVIYGRSSRGTKTRDTYSLNGFSAAYKAIGEECGR